MLANQQGVIFSARCGHWMQSIEADGKREKESQRNLFYRHDLMMNRTANLPVDLVILYVIVSTAVLLPG